MNRFAIIIALVACMYTVGCDGKHDSTYNSGGAPSSAKAHSERDVKRAAEKWYEDSVGKKPTSVRVASKSAKEWIVYVGDGIIDVPVRIDPHTLEVLGTVAGHLA